MRVPFALLISCACAWLSVAAAPLCDPLWCLPKRETFAGFWRSEASRHYCSAPHAIKASACVVKGAPVGAAATTFKRFCKSAEFITLRTDAGSAEARDLQAAAVGTVLLHSSVGARNEVFWCQASAPAGQLTPAERLATAMALPPAFLTARVYNNNQPKAEEADETTALDVLARLDASGAHQRAVVETMCSTESAAERALCVALPQVTTARVACGALLAAVTLRGLGESATLACAGGVLTATVAAVPATPVAAPVRCRLRSSVVQLTPEWAAVAIDLAVAVGSAQPPSAVAHEAMRARLELLLRASRGIPHAIRPFAWAFLARHPALLRTPYLVSHPLAPSTYTDLVAEAERLSSLPADDATSCVAPARGRIAPCDGLKQIRKDATRSGSAKQLYASNANLFPDSSDAFAEFLLPSTQFLARADATIADASDKRRFAAFMRMSMALELLFEPEHSGPKAQRMRAADAEFKQSTTEYTTLFFAQALPESDAFLAAAALTSAIDPRDSHLAECMAPHAAADAAINAIADAAAGLAPSLRATLQGYVNGAPFDSLAPSIPVYLCLHGASFLVDLEGFTRDAEIIHRAVDMQFVLPAHQAVRVREAAVEAFVVAFASQLRRAPPTSIACAFSALGVPAQGSHVISDVFSPPADAWANTVLAAVAAAGPPPPLPLLRGQPPERRGSQGAGSVLDPRVDAGALLGSGGGGGSAPHEDFVGPLPDPEFTRAIRASLEHSKGLPLPQQHGA